MAPSATDTSNGDSDSIPTIPLQINGEEVKTATSFPIVSPATKKKIWYSSSASVDDAIRATEAAQAAFPSWSRTKAAYRRDILLKAASLIESRKEELIDYMRQETGAEDFFARNFNIPLSQEIVRDVAGRIAVAIAGSVPESAHNDTNAIVYKEPYGVILAIAPWNAPYILGIRSIVYALAAGNTCVLKGPELAPRCYWAIGSIFAEAGLPSGVLNVIIHRAEDAAEVTNALIAHPAIRKVNFTGSTNVGSIISSTAGKYLKPVLMELGGKGSVIICEDADLEKAAKECALGSFLHSGQICMITERIIVPASLHSAFISHFLPAINALYGPSTPAPVLISSGAVQKNKSLVRDALSKGATLLLGTAPPEISETETETETTLRPLVLTNLTPSMTLYHTESFGPTVSLIPSTSLPHAIQIANDSPYGLTASVFTRDLAQGLKVARELEVGAVHVNGMSVHDEAGLPHGGVKGSGWGRFNAGVGLEEFLKSKTVTWKG
ncbi:MAG: hypothetical protein M1834_008968 [Cirrosporium novae-zelandiae]|nr:MAG: hypothetical protein M1834_008968 [Cirrosporium novae-zelandiae]